MKNNLLQLDLFENNPVEMNPLYLELSETRQSLDRTRRSLFAKIGSLEKLVSELTRRLAYVEIAGEFVPALQFRDLSSARKSSVVVHLHQPDQELSLV
jgi:hypothetical protein